MLIPPRNYVLLYFHQKTTNEKKVFKFVYSEITTARNDNGLMMDGRLNLDLIPTTNTTSLQNHNLQKSCTICYDLPPKFKSHKHANARQQIFYEQRQI